MSNKVYRSFLHWSLQSAFGQTGPAEEVKFYIYATNIAFGFNHAHQTLADVTAGSVTIKSKEVHPTIFSDASLEIGAIIDLFEEQELVNVTGIILVAEWMDGDVEKNRLVAYMDTWDQSVIPVNTTERIKLAFEQNFVFRIGSVAAL